MTSMSSVQGTLSAAPLAKAGGAALGDSATRQVRFTHAS